MKYLTPLRAHLIGAGALCVLIIAIDCVTKYVALSFMGGATHVGAGCFVHGPCLSFELVLNRGVSWGFFAPESALGFAILSMFIAVVTMVIAAAACARWRAGASFWAELFIIAGSAGNVIDRLFYGYVVDFIKVSWGAFSWPVFNIADCCIVLGAALLFLRILKNKN
jgi:signal peptidase II